MKKYELIEVEENDYGLKYRAKALRDFRDVKKGDLSGLISNENSISQEGNCWVYYDAAMHHGARIFDNAILYNNAKMYGNTRLYGNAKMFHNAIMFDNAEMHENTEMHDHTMLHNNAMMDGAAQIHGYSGMHGNSIMMNCTRIYDGAQMTDDAMMFGDAEMRGYSVISGTHKLKDKILRYQKLYKYISRPILDGSEKVTEIKMGCHTKTIDMWRISFRNNTPEFPIGSDAEVDRLNAINYILMTLGEDLIQLDK